MQALKRLRRVSLLTLSQDTSSIHRLVQDVVFNDMGDAEREEAFHTVLHILTLGFPRESFSRSLWNLWQECERLLPHVQFLVRRYEATKMDSKGKCPKLADLLSSVAW
jgi:hypothetical protein